LKSAIREDGAFFIFSLEMKYNFRKILGAAVLLYFGFLIYQGCHNLSKIKNIDKAPDEYLSIFKGTVLPALKLVQGQQTTDKPPLCSFIYNNEYSVFMTQMNNIFDYSLRTLIKEKCIAKKFSRSNGKWYHVARTRFLNIDCLVEPEKPTNELILTFSSLDYKRLALNDTIAYYHFFAPNFTLQYDENWSPEFNVSLDKENPSKKLVASEVIILKKNNKYYFILMSIQKENAELATGALLELIETP
jgi:hypothetical protein